MIAEESKSYFLSFLIIFSLVICIIEKEKQNLCEFVEKRKIIQLKQFVSSPLLARSSCQNVFPFPFLFFIFFKTLC